MTITTTTPIQSTIEPPSASPRPRRSWASLRQAYDLALAGALGGLFGLYLYVELVRTDSVYVRDALAGAILGGSIGFFLNAWGPWRDGAWRKLARAVAWGTPAAALGGALGLVLGEVVIGVFQGGLLGRAASWAVLGLGIGLGQGLADRSWQRLTFGLIGGGLGGFVGGLCFEALRVALGNRYDLSQALGIVILGGGLGLFLALVEQALRRAWVQIASGRQEGRIYLLARPRCRLGLDERAEVGVFGDAAVEREHAEIERTSQGYMLRNLAKSGATKVNGVACSSARVLNDGDRIELGRTSLVFRRR
ncbi:MAG: FHA domain-containing protein [Paludisphaera borealis]|uniref:FHA domain-containing protein n=1 Tax=Paludisphaera borealis TaxID=1387353 RepID=UPI0028497572|nr:FHA domain-containing protein [Paludisphaera borealis]MDR3622263.1 FHA domain-containing protein [Paludisphaera borealis]